MERKVWIIDDDEVDIFIHSRMLKKAGFADDIVTFTSGDEAIKNLMAISDPSEMPDAIFLDLMMPLYSGWDFLEEFKDLKDYFDHSRIVVLTTSVFLKDLAKAMSYNSVSKYLVKPIDIEKLEKLNEEFIINDQLMVQNYIQN